MGNGVNVFVSIVFVNHAVRAQRVYAPGLDENGVVGELMGDLVEERPNRRRRADRRGCVESSRHGEAAGDGSSCQLASPTTGQHSAHSVILCVKSAKMPRYALSWIEVAGAGVESSSADTISLFGAEAVADDPRLRSAAFSEDSTAEVTAVEWEWE